MENSRAGIYWQLRLPPWFQAFLYAVLAGGLWFVLARFASAESITVRLALAALFGVPFGVLMAWTVNRQQRIFGTSDVDERIAIVRAIDDGRLPGDPRLRPAAMAIVRQRLRRIQSTGVQAVFLVVFLLICVARAIWSDPSWWVLVVLYVVALPYMFVVSRRQQRGAQRLRESMRERSDR
jgi:hypothetical protein